MERIIQCICGNSYDETQLKKHIKECKLFLQKFQIFDYKIAFFLENILSEKKNLFLVRFFFKRYMKLIDHKIKLYLKEKGKIIKKEEDSKVQENTTEKPFNDTEEEAIFAIENNKINNIANKYENEIIEDNSIIKNSISNNIINIKYDNIFNDENENEKNSNVYKANTKDLKKQEINNKLKNENEDIKSSKSSKFNNSKFKFKNLFSFFHSHKITRCKFCQNEIGKDEICDNKRCKEIIKYICENKLSCGHDCLGVCGEIICPPCLDSKCKYYGGIFNQNKDTCCQICLEKLSSSPIVNLSCNHYVHYFCIIKQLKKGENLSGKKLNFNFIKCPVCDLVFECPSVPEIQSKIKYYKKIYMTIYNMNMIEQRLIYEKINSNKDPFDIFIFYLCYKCKRPYYAGRNNKANNYNKKYFEYENKEDCLCGKDSFVYNAKGESFCKKHGFEFIEYKCKFCCKIASRFFSQTHFCEECYSNKNFNNNEICEIKKCDKYSCEFKGMHAPNGIEYCLGCFFCRLENIKNEYPIFE